MKLPVKFIIEKFNGGIWPSGTSFLWFIHLKNTELLKSVSPKEAKQLQEVWEIPEVIAQIKNPSELVQLEAVQQQGKMIQYIYNPSEKVQIAAVRQNDNAFGIICEMGIKPTERVQLEAVKINGINIANIIYAGIEPSEQVQLEAVKNYTYAFWDIRNPSEKVQLFALSKDPRMIRDITNS
jgi:hypothetical protein